MSECKCDFSLGQWSCRCGALAREKARARGETVATPQEERRDFMAHEGFFHGWYSEKQRQYAQSTLFGIRPNYDGTVTYYNLSGEPVRITEITRSARDSNWDDAVYVGIVQMGTYKWS